MRRSASRRSGAPVGPWRRSCRAMTARPRSSASCACLDKRHRDAGVGEGHGDAAAHGAGADHRDRLDLARLAPAGRSSTLPPARSAKKMWRSAFDWSPATSSRNVAARASAPRRPGRSSDHPTASTQAATAFDPRARRIRSEARASNAVRSARAAASLSSRRAARHDAGILGQHFPGQGNRLGHRTSATAATSPAASASFALIGSPLAMMRNAASGPTTRGRRCVPRRRGGGRA